MKVSNVHTHGGARYAYSKRFGWLRWHNSELAACLCGWLPVNKPKHLL
jgi:hypothetical protein